MRVVLSEDERDWVRSVADMLASRCPPTLVRAVQRGDGDEPMRELWSSLAAIGVFEMGPAVEPADAGTLFELGLFFREAGRVLCPTAVYSTIAGGLALRRVGAPGHLTDRLGAGGLRAATALWNPSDARDVRPSLTAHRAGGGWQLEGTVDFVADADTADVLVVAARRSEGAAVIALLEPGQSGVAIDRHRTLGRDVQCRITLDGAGVSDPARMLCTDGPALGWIGRAMLALQCMEMVGGGERVLARTVDHLKERVQFGRPLASFQATQHQVADMAIAIDGARLAAMQATWLIAHDRPCDRELAIAKHRCNEAYKGATLAAHQLHGGMGYVRETDLHLFSERAKTTELLGGTSDRQLRHLADALAAR